MLNKKETQTWSVMCDKCHKILDREYLKEVVEMIEKQNSHRKEEDNLLGESSGDTIIAKGRQQAKTLSNEDNHDDIKEKPRGWANLKQQLKEIRDESFKQGVWAGQNSQKEKDLDELKKIEDKPENQDEEHGEFEYVDINWGEWERIKQKIKGEK